MAEKNKAPEVDLAAIKAEIKAELQAEMQAAPVRGGVFVNRGDPADEEYVEIKLYKGPGAMDDVFVGVNGDTCAIKRGERVKIKRKFAKVLELSMEQSEFAMSVAEGLAKDFDANAAAVN